MTTSPTTPSGRNVKTQSYVKSSAAEPMMFVVVKAIVTDSCDKQYDNLYNNVLGRQRTASHLFN